MTDDRPTSPADGTARSTDGTEPDGRVDEVVVERDGTILGRARVSPASGVSGVTVIGLEPDRTRATADQRAELVDAALDHPAVERQVHVVTPLGDAASVGRLRERTTSYDAHPAGTSSVIDAEVASDER